MQSHSSPCAHVREDYGDHCECCFLQKTRIQGRQSSGAEESWREMRGRRWWRRRSAREARNEVYLLRSARNPLTPRNSWMESLILVDTLCVWPFWLDVTIPTTCGMLRTAGWKVQESSHTNQGILVTLSKITLSTNRSPQGGFCWAFWSLSKSVWFAILKRQF